MDAWFQNLLGNEIGLIISILVKILFILVPLILVVVPYLTYFERKVIGYMQLRVGPNVNGPWGLLQPYLDVVKLLVKEVILPSKSNRILLMVAPAMVLAPSLVVWVTLPMSREWVMTNLNV
ncbi:MAG: NADH-quinone oxidoreductase subunit H, partial [Neisseriaceae bacterium]|nr:NADH-quinone oxidoreductase subunit H [Neisseriaceae bacterium]